jgi:hypothetical protein
MRFLLLVFFSAQLFFFLLPPTAAASQIDPAYYRFDGRLTGTVEPSGLRLEIQLDGNPWSVNTWTATPSGIDVYRSDIGVECGSWELVTDEPVAWSWVDDSGGGPHMSFELVDVTAIPNQGYMYYARAVDTDRNPIPENEDAYLGAATHGVALLGHGTLYGGPGGCGQSYRQEVWNCYPECFPALLFGDTSPDVTPYINSGTTVLLYGIITDVTSLYCGTNETIASFSSAIPGNCVVGVENRTWGSVKELYR